MAKITGIGGVFFKAKTDNKTLREWYQKHLGLELEEWGGGALRWPEDKSEDKGVTAWHVAEPTTKWFSPSESSFMINYRIDNMEEMIMWNNFENFNRTDFGIVHLRQKFNL